MTKKDIVYFRSEVEGDTFWISWNKSATFNVYFNNKEIDCFTDYVKHREQAIQSASDWVKDNGLENFRYFTGLGWGDI